MKDIVYNCCSQLNVKSI